MFVRPDSPLKLFAGQVATQESFAADLEFMGFYEFPVSSLVVVGPPHEILAEWRFVIADHQVAAGCQYRRGGEFDSQPEYDERAFKLAQVIAGIDYQPDPVWIMDICQTADGAFHLLEIGGFSFADLYACDMTDVVAAASSAAATAWKNLRAAGTS